MNMISAMNRTLYVCAALALAGCASAPKVRVANGELVLDSPYDLEVGSEKYAKMLGSALRSDTHVSKWHGKVTTNTYCWGKATLTKPYFGFDRMQLSFKEGKLDSVHLSSSRNVTGEDMSFDECRSIVKKMADDFEAKTGVPAVGHIDQDENEAIERLEELRKEIAEDAKKGGRKTGGFASSFVFMSGERKINDVDVVYDFCGMVNDKRKCNVSASIRVSDMRPVMPARQKWKIPVHTNSASSFLGGTMQATDEQKKAHEAAAGLREAVARLSGVDFDKPDQKVQFPIDASAADGADTPKKEWSALESPFAGMDERKLSQSISLCVIPYCSFSLRHAYAGDAAEDERDALAREFLAALEKECGAKIEATDGQKHSLWSEAAGEGAPTFGDTRAIFRQDVKTHFTGRLGDITLDIKSAPPRYVVRNGKHEIVTKGAVVAEFAQSPIFSGIGK